MNLPTAEEMRAIEPRLCQCHSERCKFVRESWPALIAMRAELDRLRDMPTVTALAALESELTTANAEIERLRTRERRTSPRTGIPASKREGVRG